MRTGILSLVALLAAAPPTLAQLSSPHFPEIPRPAPRPIDAGAFLSFATPRQEKLQMNAALPEHPQNPAPRKPSSLPPMKQHTVGRLTKRQAIEDYPAPFPPSNYIDVNNLTTIAVVAQAAIARMQTWYEDGVFEWTGWWQTPVLGIAYTNLDLALGNNVNELLIKDLLISNDDLGWMIDKYIDDQSWWAMFALRAHQAYPNQTWFDLVQNIEYNNTAYWDDTCGGGVLWLTYRPMIKNTITNGLYFSILTRLYRFTGDPRYYEFSMNTLNWWLGWGFDETNGRVFDTITGPECNVTGEGWWSYNSGAFIYGLADLWYATKDEKILNLARSIAYAGMRDFSNPATGVMVESCEDDPPPAPGKPPGCQQDETLFKGIFMLAISELYLARPDQNIYNFVNTQLLSNLYNNVDDSWLFGMWWGGPWNETTAGPKTQMNTICVLAAAATVNSDFLTRKGLNTLVPAMQQVPVPSNSSATGMAGTIRDGGTSGSERKSVELVMGTLALLAAGVALLR